MDGVVVINPSMVVSSEKLEESSDVSSSMGSGTLESNNFAPAVPVSSEKVEDDWLKIAFLILMRMIS